MKVDRQSLFCSGARPIKGLYFLMQHYEADSLEHLQIMIAQGYITLPMVLRIRGNGSRHNPGRAARYLFPATAQHRTDRVAERIRNNLGAGI